MKLESIVGLTNLFKDYYYNKKLKETKLLKDLKKITITDYNMIYIHGKRGNGKSFAAQAYAVELKKGFSKIKIKYISLTRMIWNFTNMNFQDKDKYINDLTRKYDVLIIDEIDKLKISEHAEGIFFVLLDERINNILPTILIGNSTGAELEGKLKESISSRIFSKCIIIENKGEILR